MNATTAFVDGRKSPYKIESIWIGLTMRSPAMTDRLYGGEPLDYWEKDAHPESARAHMAARIRELEDQLTTERARGAKLAEAINKALNEATGIYPKSITQNGVTTGRTEWQSGWNQAVMEMGNAIDQIEALVEAYQSSKEPGHTCKGANCGSTDPRFHSAECFAEHDAAIDAAKED